MKKPLLECCVDTVESALAAKEGGADRLELCANLLIGGTTPDINLYHRIRERCDILINVLIRPRFGDFCYTDEEFEIIRRDVKMFREAKADGGHRHPQTGRQSGCRAHGNFDGGSRSDERDPAPGIRCLLRPISGA